MKMRFIFFLSLIVMLRIQALANVEDPRMKAFEEKALKVKPFDLSQVRLLNGPFKHAQNLNRRSLLNYETDRLLSKFRTTAGLEQKAEPYSGWEAQGIAGHSLGHYLSACSIMYASTGDKLFKERVDYIVDELEACQQGNGNGYAMCVPRGKELFKEVSEGKITTQRFNLNGCWVPIYTLHKEMSGLRDAYRLCSNKKALQVERRLADWFDTIIDDLTDEQMQKVMYCEHGGITEALAGLSADTGEQKYLEMAKKFHHKEIMDPMINGRDVLSGYHANTQIPKFVGLARIHELTGDISSKIGTEFFWDRVVNHHSYVTGGHCFNEYFGSPDMLNERLGTNTTETCNVYNMLKLTGHLFCWNPRASVADFYERALYNHILSSQHPRDGRLIYNLTLEMGGFKNYQDPFWFTCCVGSGMENHSQYGNSIYYHNDKELYVNLFIASELNWKNKGLKITQNTGYPDEDKIKLTFSCKSAIELALNIRYPYWAQKGIEVKVNGKEQQVTSISSSYIRLSRRWKEGDVVDIRIPMTLRLETMPDNPKRVAVMFGPLVLAGELGPVDDPKARELVYVPVLLTSHKPIEQWIVPFSDKPNTFKLSNVGQPRDVVLYPFYNMHDKRYTIFWDIFTLQEWNEKKNEYERIQQEKLKIEARTVDFVQPGEQESEVGHNLQFESSNADPKLQGFGNRSAFDGGWFSYDFTIVPDGPLILRVSYVGDRNEAIFDLEVDSQKIAEQKLEKLERDQRRVLFNIDYKLPKELIKNKNKITVKFAAREDQRTGSVCGVRILKEEK
ncbi:MAG: glycoside hydrolase family 127 protein [Planctomycetes bacterium]|nr:glycoside hydrolase family 127 protein [Planctomycetota bacterium]MBL7143247.1 glycoside hydrolase family 127 protein [Phycisphaerae bacterium]